MQCGTTTSTKDISVLELAGLINIIWDLSLLLPLSSPSSKSQGSFFRNKITLEISSQLSSAVFANAS